MKRAVFEKDFIRVEDSETGTPGAFLKFAFQVQAALYKLRYRFVHVKPQDKKYNVAVCAIFKNEAPYLKEWIEFNHLVGVEHFYLYNNNSEDDYQSVLEEYVQSGLVTLIQFPYEQAQMKCYKDCIDKYAGETKWLGFIDIDEFIVPKSTNDIYGFLKPFETKRGAVKLNWQLFGTSGRMDRDIEGLVAEDFTSAGRSITTSANASTIRRSVSTRIRRRMRGCITASGRCTREDSFRRSMHLTMSAPVHSARRTAGIFRSSSITILRSPIRNM